MIKLPSTSRTLRVPIYNRFVRKMRGHARYIPSQSNRSVSICNKLADPAIAQKPFRSQKSTAFGSVKKSTAFGRTTKKAPPLAGKKAPPLVGQKAPSNYLPWPLYCVVGWKKLQNLLREHGQHEWDTNVRKVGLLCLLDLIARLSRSHPRPISSSLAHQLTSPHKRAKHSSTEQQPLDVLLTLGLVERVQEHLFAPNVCRAATYQIHQDYSENLKKRMVLLNPKQIEKLKNFDKRKNTRLNRSHPWREQLLTDLYTLSLSKTGKSLALDLLVNKNKEQSTRTTLELINGKREWSARPSDVGQIIIPLNQFPRELKAELLLGGRPTELCDISHAHHCFLTRLVMRRIDYLKKENAPARKITEYEAELDKIRIFLSTGDYYRKWCVNPDSDKERGEKKLLLTMLLNWRNEKAKGNSLYRRMRAEFPLTFQIVEDLKRTNHRVISLKMRNYTARVINAALMSAQNQRIPAIPDVDALLCPTEHKEVVCNFIGEELFRLSGVCAKVGGIRYAPQKPIPSSSDYLEDSSTEKITQNEHGEPPPVPTDPDSEIHTKSLPEAGAVSTRSRTQPICLTCEYHGRHTPVIPGNSKCHECGNPWDICIPF